MCERREPLLVMTYGGAAPDALSGEVTGLGKNRVADLGCAGASGALLHTRKVVSGLGMQLMTERGMFRPPYGRAPGSAIKRHSAGARQRIVVGLARPSEIQSTMSRLRTLPLAVSGSSSI